MLNSSKYVRKHAQIRDSFVVKFSSHRLKRAHYAGKHCSCATMELWMHLGGLLITQEARVALGYRLVRLLPFFRA